MLILCASAIWLYSHDIGKVQRIIVTPFIGNSKIALLLRLQTCNTFTEQSLEFDCPFKRIILCPAFLQSIIHKREISERIGCQAREITIMAKCAPHEAGELVLFQRCEIKCLVYTWQHTRLCP